MLPKFGTTASGTVHLLVYYSPGVDGHFYTTIRNDEAQENWIQQFQVLYMPNFQGSSL